MATSATIPKSTAPARPRQRSALTLVTSRQAMNLLAMPYTGQRPLRQHHVRFLRYLIRTGHWRQGSEVHVATIEREKFLVNGQHTLSAILAEGIPVWLNVIEYDVQTLAEVGKLYETFDRNLLRSLDDIYQSDPEIQNLQWSKKELKAVSGAVTHLALGFRQETRYGEAHTMLRDPFVRIDLMRTWVHEATQAFAGFTRGKIRQTLYRSAVMSVVLATYRWQPTLAQRFWPAVCRDSGLTEGQPERALVHFLLTTPARLMLGSAYARHVAAAWNAAYDARPMQTLTARAQGNPIRLAGTPHDGEATHQYLSATGEALRQPHPW